jgi:hypothetical protein
MVRGSCHLLIKLTFRRKLNLFVNFLLLSTVVLAAGCDSQENDEKSTSQGKVTASNVAWQNRWLLDIPCRLPCWENITPGKTTAHEAKALLENNPLVTNVEMGAHQDQGEVNWDWANGTPGGQLKFHNNTPGKIIYSIEPSYVNYPAYYKLGTIIKAFGEPDYVEALAGISLLDKKRSYNLYYFYSKIGVSISAGDGGTKPVLSGDLFVNAFGFNDTDPNGVFMQNIKNNPGMILPWEGYKNYDFYCRLSPRLIEMNINNCN